MAYNMLTNILFGNYMYPIQIAICVGTTIYNSFLFASNISQMPLCSAMTQSIVGIFAARGIWVASEYSIHRWVLHGPLYANYHKNHHEHYTDKRWLFTPLIMTTTTAYTYYTVLRWTIGGNLTAAIFIFLPLNYLFFEWLHWQIHSPIRDKNSILWMAQQYHRAHHMYPNKNYGITSPAMDYLTNTLD